MSLGRSFMQEHKHGWLNLSLYLQNSYRKDILNKVFENNILCRFCLLILFSNAVNGSQSFPLQPPGAVCALNSHQNFAPSIIKYPEFF